MSELRELRQVREENRKLKGLVADLTLDKQILQESLRKKMVTPTARRAWVAWVEEAYRLSRRRACRVTGVHRALLAYRLRKPPQLALRARLKELAAARVSSGYLRLHTLLVREGWPVNRKRILRLYREEGLQLRVKRPRRRRSAVPRGPRVVATRPNEIWALDFAHDTLADGRSILVLTLMDCFTRECLTLAAAPRFTGDSVARAVAAVGAHRGLPERITVDKGTEFTSRALDAWAYWNQVHLDFSRPGKPVDNCLIEAFNGSLRRECLSQHWFASIAEAQQPLTTWQEEYNTVRPHMSLSHRSPRTMNPGGHYLPDLNRLPICSS